MAELPEWKVDQALGGGPRRKGLAVAVQPPHSRSPGILGALVILNLTGEIVFHSPTQLQREAIQKYT